jgi:hypothetical protein
VLAVQTVAQGNRSSKDTVELLRALHALLNMKTKWLAVKELSVFKCNVKAFKFPMYVKTRWVVVEGDVKSSSAVY